MPSYAEPLSVRAIQAARTNARHLRTRQYAYKLQTLFELTRTVRKLIKTLLPEGSGIRPGAFSMSALELPQGRGYLAICLAALALYAALAIGLSLARTP